MSRSMPEREATKATPERLQTEICRAGAHDVAGFVTRDGAVFEGDGDVLHKVLGDIKAKGVEMTEAQLRVAASKRWRMAL